MEQNKAGEEQFLMDGMWRLMLGSFKQKILYNSIPTYNWYLTRAENVGQLESIAVFS